MKSHITIEIPFKCWMLEQAERLGITKHALEMRIQRRRHIIPHPVKRGARGRAISVIIHTDKIPQTV